MISNEFTLSKLYPLCKAKDNRNSVHIFDYCDIFHLENKKQQQQLWSVSASKKKKDERKVKDSPYGLSKMCQVRLLKYSIQRVNSIYI